MRLKPWMAAQPVPGSRLLHCGEGGVHEVVAAGALEEVAAGSGHVAELGAGAGEQSAWERSGYCLR